MQQQPQQPAVDKLVIAVVRNDDANTIVDELVKRRIGNTRINTAGGVLRRGNVTLLVGVPASQVDETLDVIRENVSGQPLTGRGQSGNNRGVAFVVDAGRYVRFVSGRVENTRSILRPFDTLRAGRLRTN